MPPSKANNWLMNSPTLSNPHWVSGWNSGPHSCRHLEFCIYVQFAKFDIKTLCANHLKYISGNNPLHVAALAGSYKVAKLLMLRCPLLPYYTNHSGKFPQQCATECGNRQVLHLLISTISNIRPIIQPQNHGLEICFQLMVLVLLRALIPLEVTMVA